jgi:hypothetical protein
MLLFLFFLAGLPAGRRPAKIAAVRAAPLAEVAVETRIFLHFFLLVFLHMPSILEPVDRCNRSGKNLSVDPSSGRRAPFLGGSLFPCKGARHCYNL